MCQINFERAQGHSLSVMGDFVYIFGGFANGKFKNSMHVINLKTWEIDLANCQGSLPEERAYHSAIVFGNKILIYGGLNDRKILRDYHVYNTANSMWTTSELHG